MNAFTSQILRLVCTFLIVAAILILRAEDPEMLKRDGKDAAEIHKLILHQQIDNAKIAIILSKYAQTHNCPTAKAGLNGLGQIQCEQQQQMKPVPVTPPGTAR